MSDKRFGVRTVVDGDQMYVQSTDGSSLVPADAANAKNRAGMSHDEAVALAEKMGAPAEVVVL